MEKILLQKNVKRILVLFILLLISGALCFSFVRAEKIQEKTSGLQVSPVRFGWDMNSGEKKIGVINLKNYDDSPRLVTIEVEDFYVTDATTEARFFVPDSNHPFIAYDVINWIDVPESIELAPQEGRDIMFHVNVPQDSPTGGYYGAIFFNTKMDDNSQNQGSKIIINQRIGALLVMAVKGSQPISRSGEIIDFSATKKIFWDRPAELIADVYNSGNLHYKMLGEININKFGYKMEKINLGPRILYPSKTRKYEQSWDFSSWAYGYYTAKINLISEDGAIKLSKETSFLVIPWKTTVSILILLIIIWLTMKLFSRKFEIKRKDEKKDIESNH